MVYNRVRGCTSGRNLPVWKFVEYPPDKMCILSEIEALETSGSRSVKLRSIPSCTCQTCASLLKKRVMLKKQTNNQTNKQSEALFECLKAKVKLVSKILLANCRSSQVSCSCSGINSTAKMGLK